MAEKNVWENLIDKNETLKKASAQNKDLKAAQTVAVERPVFEDRTARPSAELFEEK
jgi:hypothetical protein